MKIKSLTLRNYKRFTNEQTISFCNEQGQVNDITLLIGENGSGKTLYYRHYGCHWSGKPS
ncbi:MAG: AAA family ATPase [Sphingobacteriales bacterium]|nr:AAA family ATPase [Sphingobacteriales bacterium]